MKMIRVFPRRTSLTPTDELAFVGDPPLDRPEAEAVHVSCTFTWDIKRAKRLALAWGQYYPTKLGGPAFDARPDGFIPGRYVKQGVTFTSRGCDNQCPWCLVRQREGKLREITRFPEGNIIQDNNFLQTIRQHRAVVYGMLTKQKAIEFSGGLDARLLTDWDAEMIRGLRVKQLFLACDTKGAIEPLRRAVNLLAMPRDKVRCYVLLAFNGETINEATARLEDVWHAGAMPFAQLYQPADKWIDYSTEWKHLARTWSRPAATKALMGKV